MTENEELKKAALQLKAMVICTSIKTHRSCSECVNENYCGKDEYDTDKVFAKSANTIFDALEELQQYRAIGTVEQLRTMFDGFWKLKDLCEEYEKFGLPEDYWKLNEMCKEYSAIGTIEECNNAVKLIRPRKPYEGSFGVLLCSLCGEKVGQMVTKTIKEDCMNFCANCGSMVDWSE